MKHLFLLKQYGRYRWRAKSAHGIHSPFVYDFIVSVLEDKRHFYDFDRIGEIREGLYGDQRSIDLIDLGAGSLSNSRSTRRIGDIAKTSGRSRKYGELLFRIVDHYGYKQILELGTSLGLGTLYLAAAAKNGQVITIEGSSTVAAEAQKTFASWPELPIQQHVGNFDDLLQPVLAANPVFDLVVIDGNHREKPTLEYVDALLPHIQPNTLILLDDIHWSAEMQRAWETICRHPAVKLSIDLFQFGLIFFDPSFHEKQQFILKF